MASFHVLIVGGSVAGLTLANVLEQYGIEYTVIEKHRTIAPQVGASIGMLPHGSRILEQLGCYYEMRAMCGPVTGAGVYGPDGNALNINPKSGDGLKEMLVFRYYVYDRLTLLTSTSPGSDIECCFWIDNNSSKSCSKSWSINQESMPPAVLSR